MGLKTDLRALVSGAKDSEIDEAFASLGFVPQAKEVDVEKSTKEAMEAGLIEGAKTGKRDALEKIAAVMEKAQIARVSNLKFLAELFTMTPEEAGKKIIDTQADQAASAEVFSTVNPMSNGGENPLIADAKKRAEVK